MPFVVKITGRGGTIAWLGAPNSDGLRTLAGRKSADIFPDLRRRICRDHKTAPRFR